MKKTIYIMRHGRTRGNVEKYYATPAEPVLFDEPAFSRAKREVAKLRPRAIVSSPYLRAKQTAEAVRPVDMPPIEEEPLLKEVSLGVLEGLDFSTAYARYGEALDPWMADPFTQAPPAGESLETAYIRARAFLEKAEEGVLYIGHEGIIRLMRCAAAGDLRRFFAFSVRNLEIVPVEWGMRPKK